MAMIRTASVVAVLWIVLVVGIGVEKCRSEDESPSKQISSEKHASGTDIEEKAAKYKEARDKATVAFKEAKEIWSSMSPEEKEKAKSALKKAKEKSGAAKDHHHWSEKTIEKIETALKEEKEKAKDKADAAWIGKVEAALKEAKQEAEAKATPEKGDTVKHH